MGGGMSVQFAAIPIRALTDTRLGGPDFRLLGTIARYDRFGRNGAGCYVNARKLAQEAGIHYKHLGRQTQRLEAFGYITIETSKTDKRRKIYTIIYDETEIVTCVGDNLDGDAPMADTAPPLAENVTSSDDNTAEKVTNPNSQVLDPLEKSGPPKRLSEANRRDPAKPRARDGEITVTACDREKSTNHARQSDRGGGESEPHGHLKWPPHGLKARNQPPRNQASAVDLTGWANWLSTQPGFTKYSAIIWIGKEIEAIKTERGVDFTEAAAMLDGQLKRRRKAAA